MDRVGYLNHGELEIIDSVGIPGWAKDSFFCVFKKQLDAEDSIMFVSPKGEKRTVDLEEKVFQATVSENSLFILQQLPTATHGDPHFQVVRIDEQGHQETIWEKSGPLKHVWYLNEPIDSRLFLLRDSEGNSYLFDVVRREEFMLADMPGTGKEGIDMGNWKMFSGRRLLLENPQKSETVKLGVFPYRSE